VLQLATVSDPKDVDYGFVYDYLAPYAAGVNAKIEIVSIKQVNDYGAENGGNIFVAGHLYNLRNAGAYVRSATDSNLRRFASVDYLTNEWNINANVYTSFILEFSPNGEAVVQNGMAKFVALMLSFYLNTTNY
jgi:hypothetical protein